RVPSQVALPNAPSFTLPPILSPVTLPVNSSLIGIGCVRFAHQLTLSPSHLPSCRSRSPCAPFIFPVSLPPELTNTKAAFCAPIGVFIVTFQLPSALISSSCTSFDVQ